MNKTKSRLRRALKTRSKISELNVHRLSIHRTSQHIYAQVIAPAGDYTLVAASSVEP
ncbi:MAG: 50S ribosomal protein L18, partial [Gammaproteobacteria bacterium]